MGNSNKQSRVTCERRVVAGHPETLVVGTVIPTRLCSLIRKFPDGRQLVEKRSDPLFFFQREGSPGGAIRGGRYAGLSTAFGTHGAYTTKVFRAAKRQPDAANRAAIEAVTRSGKRCAKAWVKRNENWPEFENPGRPSAEQENAIVTILKRAEVCPWSGSRGEERRVSGTAGNQISGRPAFCLGELLVLSRPQPVLRLVNCLIFRKHLDSGSEALPE